MSYKPKILKQYTKGSPTGISSSTEVSLFVVGVSPNYGWHKVSFNLNFNLSFKPTYKEPILVRIYEDSLRKFYGIYVQPSLAVSTSYNFGISDSVYMNLSSSASALKLTVYSEADTTLTALGNECTFTFESLERRLT